ncbi:MAG TPA: hypothetical protein VIW92_02665 [Thermoanaerobaculia bacterium]
MRKVCILVSSLLMCASLAAAQERPLRTERRLDALAGSFAKALQDRSFRESLQKAIASSETGDSVRLRDLQLEGKAFQMPVGMTEVDVSVLPGLAEWNAAAEIPLVVYTWEGETRGRTRAFDASGKGRPLDVGQPLPYTVVVLEVHDTRKAVEVVEGPEAGLSGPDGTGGFQEKLLYECSESATYSSYPLIVNASIWDAHESSVNGPKGYLYFTAAGNEKTGNLPASLGGRTGWSTNVWASNFQGPVPEGNTRVQWEWTADGWLEQAPYRTYPAVYCRQSASSTAGFSLNAYTIREDDEWPNGDDYVGKVQIDHRYCKSDVFDLGLTSGWSARHTTSGLDDVISTTYDLYCSTSYQCVASAQCPDGRQIFCSGSGSCGGSCWSGEGAVQCGDTYKDCSEPVCPGGQVICEPM